MRNLKKAILLEAGFAAWWGREYAKLAGNPYIRKAFVDLAVENRAWSILEADRY